MFSLRVVSRTSGEIKKQTPFNIPTKAEARRRGKTLRLMIGKEFRVELMKQSITLVEEIKS